jgi:hypothetical protein
MEGDQTGWSLVSLFLLRSSNLNFSDYILGVVDTIPDKDFPDIRCISTAHSTNGSCMVIPREGDMVRLYVQLSDNQVVDPETGRIDKNKTGPIDIFEARILPLWNVADTSKPTLASRLLNSRSNLTLSI